MNNTIYNHICEGTRTLGVLLDPEKMDADKVSAFAKAISLKQHILKQKLQLDHIILLVGGSTMERVNFDQWMQNLKNETDEKVVIFPGSHNQVSGAADGLLFLNLISGRNPDYLIEQQVSAALKVDALKLEIIPTAYLLLDGGKETAVARVSKTTPMDQKDLQRILKTALAGQYMGNKLVYLEAGSGALQTVQNEVIELVTERLNIPVIVGGGLRTITDIDKKFKAGAKMVVVGTAIEESLDWI